MMIISLLLWYLLTNNEITHRQNQNGLKVTMFYYGVMCNRMTLCFDQNGKWNSAFISVRKTI